MEPATQLRRLLEDPGILVLPGVYDALSARLAEQVGFAALFTSGFGIAASSLGLPDYGLMTMTESLERVRRIVQAVSRPVVADCDTGYGNPLNVMRTVHECLAIGVAGIILEDQEWPKKCGHMQAKRVIPLAEQVEKIKAAVQARGERDLVLIGRTDAREPLGIEEALRRGKAFAEAGADVVFIEAPQSVDELRLISREIKAPTFANMIEGGKTPLLSREELRDLGFKIVVFPLSSLFAAAWAMRAVLQRLKETGSTQGFNDLADFHAFEELMRVPHYRALEQQFRVDGAA
ncbi:MAG: oxaloacetate decarboxylase [Candidatus Tectomicrobia bacterium]|nr:oxaloacetate decarboxylase [Candidatus Tectomicrobia bacterium]